MRFSRVAAYTVRYLYLYKRSLPRLMEVFYWPVLDLAVWGFISVYLGSYGGRLPAFASLFVGALILWDILFRSQQGISVSFLEDVWSRNLINVFVSPLTPAEYIASLMLLSMIKLVFTSLVMAVLALLLYSFNIFSLGFALIPLAVNLIIMGWAVGILTTAVIMRFGQEAEVLAWGIAFLFQPVAAVFYPVSVLPEPLYTISMFVPAAWVFEGMRKVVSGGPFPSGELMRAALLNAAYLAASIAYFAWNFRAVKKKGLLARSGE